MKTTAQIAGQSVVVSPVQCTKQAGNGTGWA
jgi:hypothetical protein